MAQEDILRKLVRYAMEMILLFKRDGTIVYANEAAKQQIAAGEDLIGYFVSDIFPNNFTQTTTGIDMKCTLGHDKQDMIAYRLNKTCFPVEVQVMSCEEEPGTYLCMGNDASEKVMLEKKIQQAGAEVEAASRMKSEFVANVTHELRTPVNGILGNAKELVHLETDARKLRLLSLVEHGCKNMNAIIDNILDFSKLEAGKFSLELRQFDFFNMIDFVKSNHMNKIVEKGLEFFVTISPEVPQYIIGDELRIVQILNNLLSNACKFTSVGKIVLEVVKTAQFDNRIELFFMVIDSGIGIDKADQDKLFQSFSQVDASISRRYGGTGLGLNICKQLVELMDGNIRVESEPNKGSMFAFHIWVEIPPEEMGRSSANADEDVVLQKLKSFSNEQTNDKIWQYGEPENIEELRKKMSKLILSIEMDNWEKAEMFADTVRQLTEEAPKEVKTASLRLKMAVQKENYEKATVAFEKLQALI